MNKVAIIRKNGADSIVVQPNDNGLEWNKGMAEFFNDMMILPEEEGNIALVMDADYMGLGV
jgi:hypothetical protein